MEERSFQGCIRYLYGLFWQFAILFWVAGVGGFATHRSVSAEEPPSDVALLLDGEEDYLDLKVEPGELGIDGNQEKTIEFQVLIREFRNREVLFTLGRVETRSSGISLRLRDGKTDQFHARFGSEELDFTCDARNRWVHFAIVHDGSTQTVFVNGEQTASVTQNLEMSPDGTFKIGGRNSAKYTLHGLVDNIRIWDRARSQKEIETLRKARLSGDEPGLVGYWPLDEGSGGTVRNVVGTEKGQLHGDPEWGRSSFTMDEVRTTLEVERHDRLRLGPVRLRHPRGEVRYQWYRNGKPLEQERESTLTLQNVRSAHVGTYHLKADDGREGAPLNWGRIVLDEGGWPGPNLREDEVQYRLDVPVNEEGTSPAAPVTAVTVFPGGVDPDTLQPVVRDPSGNRRASEFLWARKNEPIRVVFSTSGSFKSDRKRSDHAEFYLTLRQADQVDSGPGGTRRNGLTLETKNFGKSFADEFDHSNFDSFIYLWNESPEFDGRSLVERVQHGYHLHQPYGETPLEYLPNRGAPLSLNRYRGYFRVDKPDKDRIQDLMEKASSKQKKVQKLENKLRSLKQKVKKAKQKLKQAREEGDEDAVQNRKTALDEWTHRRDKVSKKTLPNARKEMKFARNAISEIRNNTYTFLTGSSGSSWVLIDGKRVAHWPADEELPKKGDKYYGYNEGSINLKPGVHKVEYLYVTGGTDYLTFMLWRHPAEKKPKIMEPKMFGNVAEAQVTDVRSNRGRRVPGWEITKDSRISGVPDFLEVDFRVPGGRNPADHPLDPVYRWEFGDGSTGEGPDITHLYLQSGPYDVTLKAYDTPSDEEPIWSVTQPVRVHVPYDLEEYIETADLRRFILEKDLSVYPVRHLYHALLAVEELDPDRLSYPDWRRYVLKGLAERSDAFARESKEGAVRAGEMSLGPTVALYEEAFRFFRAAAGAMEPRSPSWHRTKLREARALVLVRDEGEEALELMRRVQPGYQEVAPQKRAGWWNLPAGEDDMSRVPDRSENGRTGELMRPEDAGVVEDEIGEVLELEEAASLRLPVNEEPPENRSFTLSLRMKLLERPEGNVVLLDDETFTLRLSDGVPVILGEHGGVRKRARDPLETGRWYHLVLMRVNDKSLNLFVDGESFIAISLKNINPYLQELHLAKGPIRLRVSSVRAFNDHLSRNEHLELTVDRRWYRARSEALLSAGRAEEVEKLVEEWADMVERIQPPDPIRQTATLQRIESLVDRGSDQALLSAQDQINELLDKFPRKLLSGEFNITILDMYLGRGAHRVAANHAKRVLNLNLAPSQEAEIMARHVIALIRHGDVDQAEKAFEQLEEEHPYSKALRRARKELKSVQ